MFNRTQRDFADIEAPRANVEGALASFGMEGLEPDRETAVIVEDYAAGRITLEQAGAAIHAHVAQMSAKDALSGAA